MKRSLEKALKQEVQPFITVPFVLPHRFELAKGAKVSVRGKIDGQDYCHSLTIESRHVGQLAAKVVDPAGDRFDLIFDQDKGTASLLDPLPMPAAWAATLTKRLGEIAVALLGQIAVTTGSRDAIYGT